MCYLVSARSIAAPLLPILQKIGAELGPKLQRQLELATVRWVPDDKAAACMVRLIRATFVQQSHFVLCSNMGKEKRREKKEELGLQLEQVVWLRSVVLGLLALDCCCSDSFHTQTTVAPRPRYPHHRSTTPVHSTFFSVVRLV